MFKKFCCFRNTIIALFFVYLISVVLFVYLKSIFNSQNLSLDINNAALLIDSLNNIDVLGQVLYNYYLVCFLVAGLILLVALVGAIILTLNFNSQRQNEIIARQLSRSTDVLVYFR